HRPSTTAGAAGGRRFIVTHPLPPVDRAGVRAAGYAHTWGSTGCSSASPKKSGSIRYRRAGPTSRGVDPFLAISAGRAHFRVEDPVALVSLVQELKVGEV
ncbi:MAG: hypothetical protein M5U22_23095, partial [Thermoleophilia bacterium]|nr:hypothetical protein [Thermoleophilia bacterium]